MEGFFDAAWYRLRYADIAASGEDPITHFIRHGLHERRDPNRFFDSAWYCEHYPDVNTSGLHPLLHYLQSGAAELRNPHPRFDAVYYAQQHPEAAANPLLYHIRTGMRLGFLTEKPIRIADYLPSTARPPVAPAGVVVDIILPVYRGLAETRRCINAVLADTTAPLGRLIVVEDKSPDSRLVAWLEDLAAGERIVLLRNAQNLGFVASVNRGMEAAGQNDVVLLNSDTEVPAGWLHRLTAQAYAEPRIATVSPFSNNATICGYPDNEGGPIAFGQDVAGMDAICATVNAGRWVDVPTTVGFCMYIRRQALQETGLFDAERFTVGYGEENDFCLRATALGWRHRLACDTFVYHKGSVSFGARARKLTERAMLLIQERHSDYPRLIARHVNLNDVAGARFAITAALLRQTGAPVILMIAHNLGGGVQRHIDDLTRRYGSEAQFLLLRATDRGAALSIPALPLHPELALPAERIEDLVTILRGLTVSRVHVHHLAGMDMDIRDLVHRLDVPFDTTVHDYYGICPQTNLLPRSDLLYCEEPDIAGCNACIANRPSHGARDIVTWRAERAWQFREASRVLCPSHDTLTRLRRHGLDERAVLAPHNPVTASSWRVRIPVRNGRKFRIAVLGVLADHKGARAVARVAEALDTRTTELHLIGYPENNVPKAAVKRMRVTGAYEEADLAGLIAAVAPDLIWFPAVWPETFSYTLSAALQSGLPILATDIGAFTERLDGRPLTWLKPVATSPAQWMATLEEIQTALTAGSKAAATGPRTKTSDFYASDYLRPVETSPQGSGQVSGKRGLPTAGVVIVPERYDIGSPTPCAYIRLLQPFDHPGAGFAAATVLADHKSALDYRANVIITQRHALPHLRAADALIAHARATGARLIYDLDDDLLTIPPRHPDAAALRPLADVVRRMLEAADSVWVSTASLRQRLKAIRPDAVVVENRLDERIWQAGPAWLPFQDDPVRILCMGTTSHTHDYALIEPALVRLKQDHGSAVTIDVLGMTDSRSIAEGLNRIGPPSHASRSYPGFVNWLTSFLPNWHIGLATLIDNRFNRCKSPIKTMDYAALGLAVLASDVSVYQGSIADGPGGQLVPNDPASWYAALDWMVRDQATRRAAGAHARRAFLRQASLGADPSVRRDCLAGLGALPAS